MQRVRRAGAALPVANLLPQPLTLADLRERRVKIVGASAHEIRAKTRAQKSRKALQTVAEARSGVDLMRSSGPAPKDAFRVPGYRER